MQIYDYSDISPIQRITFRKTDGGQCYAHLYAKPDADSALLNNVICSASDRGWQVSPCNIDGRAALQILGCHSGQQLTQFLTSKHAISGPPTITINESKSSFLDKIKKRSLGTSGLVYLIGDISFATYGYKGADKLNMAAGGFYGIGTLSLLGFGRKDPSDLQIRDISKKLASFLRENGNKLPEECSIQSIIQDKNRGLIKSADDLFRRYPSEIMNLFSAAAGACIALSAHRQLHNGMVTAKEVEEVLGLNMSKILKKNPGKILSGHEVSAMRENIAHKMHSSHIRESWLDIGLGGMTAASGLVATFIKEKKPDPDAPKKEGIAAFKQKIQERPLAIAGIGYMVSTMCHAVSTTLAWNYANLEKRKTVPWRATFVGMNLIAETLLAMSSKGHGEGVKSDKSVEDTVIALAADIIVKEPVKMHNELIDYVAGFLGRGDVLAMENEVVKQRLHQEVEHMKGNPWALAAHATQPKVPANKALWPQQNIAETSPLHMGM